MDKIFSKVHERWSFYLSIVEYKQDCTKELKTMETIKTALYYYEGSYEKG